MHKATACVKRRIRFVEHAEAVERVTSTGAALLAVRGALGY
jgi:hypothetical protein